MNFPRVVGKNSRGGVHGNGPRAGICIVKTDHGAQGWGVFRGGEKKAKSLLEKYKGMPITGLFDPDIGVIDNEAEELDFALHDLAGVILDVPVYEMLGSDGPAQTDCYSGMIYFDDLEPSDNPAGIDQVLHNCQQDISLGYRQLKVKIGRGNKWMEPKAGMRRDIEVTQHIHRSFPDITILVDGNDGFTPDTFITYLEGIWDVDLFWIEEPFVEHYEGLMKLRNWLSTHEKMTLLADGEAKPGHDLLLELIRKKTLDVYLTDIQGYGFTRWRALMPTLKRLRCPASPHAWGNMLKTIYIGHLSSGLGNVVTIEGVTCQCDSVDFGANRLRDGKLHVSKSPGFGMALHL
jgi:L-alanine-DL-glutamate epimerase-like enolase superfamily enzyme